MTTSPLQKSGESSSAVDRFRLVVIAVSRQSAGFGRSQDDTELIYNLRRDVEEILARTPIGLHGDRDLLNVCSRFLHHEDEVEEWLTRLKHLLEGYEGLTLTSAMSKELRDAANLLYQTSTYLADDHRDESGLV